MEPQEEVSPKTDLRQAPTSASCPAHEMPDSQGGKTSAVGTSSWRNPVTKPISRHATSAVFCKDTMWLPRIMQWLLCQFTRSRRCGRYVTTYICMYDYIAVSTRTLTPPTTGTD